jgi:hypothetical protein
MRRGQSSDRMAFRFDEGPDLSFEIARQVIVLEQDTVLEGLMPA